MAELTAPTAFAPFLGVEHRLQSVDLVGHEAALVENAVCGTLDAARAGQGVDQPAQAQGKDDDADETHGKLPFKPFANRLS